MRIRSWLDRRSGKVQDRGPRYWSKNGPARRAVVRSSDRPQLARLYCRRTARAFSHSLGAVQLSHVRHFSTRPSCGPSSISPVFLTLFVTETLISGPAAVLLTDCPCFPCLAGTACWLLVGSTQ